MDSFILIVNIVSCDAFQSGGSYWQKFEMGMAWTYIIDNNQKDLEW